jgi:transcriptional regulator with XRE-family HTH domain
MSTYSRSIVGKNVKGLRLALGLSQLQFADITDLSKPTIINIESAKKDYSMGLIDKISTFSCYSLSELSHKSFIPEQDIREKLLKKHQSNPNFTILNKQPEIVYAIKYKLLTTDFLFKSKEIREIKRYFLMKYGWDFIGSSISNSLKRMQHLIEIQPHPSKANTNVYSAKNRKI